MQFDKDRILCDDGRIGPKDVRCADFHCRPLRRAKAGEVMAFWLPQFAGSLTIHSPRSEFLDRFEKRIQAGLLTAKPHWRAQYITTRRSDQELSFRAGTFMTALNIGLNAVDLRLVGNQRLEYVVSYRRWAGSVLVYGIALCGFIAVVSIACYLLLPGMQREIAAQPGGALVFWGSVIFWGLLWPWLLAGLLVSMHKRFARRCLIRIIEEVDGRGQDVLVQP